MDLYSIQFSIKSVERVITDRVRSKVVWVLMTVKNRGPDAILAAMDDLVSPGIDLAIKSAKSNEV